MKMAEAVRELTEVTSSQWGMVTSAQAAARGVTRLDLSRLAEAGDLVRLAQGVYRDAGAPRGSFADVRAAWLSSEPTRLADDRLKDGHRGTVVSGQTAAWIHDIGNLRSNRTELTAPVRRQTQRADLHYRRRELTEADVTIREGLPVTTVERTIADLVEDRTDMSIVADALRDAARKSELDLALLSDCLAPLARRNGHGKDDGEALLEQLLRIAGLDRETIAEEIASLDDLGALVTRNYLTRFAKTNLPALPDPTALWTAIHVAPSLEEPQLQELITALDAAAHRSEVKLLEAASTAGARALQPLSVQEKAIGWATTARTVSAPRRESPSKEAGT